MIFDDLKIGDSVSVNGTCLTVTNIFTDIFTADAVNETLKRTSFKYLKSGNRINLERPMRADSRFGGHIVAGHIDGTGVIKKIKNDNNAVLFYIDTEQQIMKYIIKKGSVAVDGISLTVAETYGSGFSVSVIPHTVKNTTLSLRTVGDIVNLENDMIGKYVEKLMDNRQTANQKSCFTKEFLTEF